MDIASNEHRLEMLRLLTEHDSRLVVSPQEMEREGYTYTVDTLTELKKNVSDREFYYVIGTDTLFSLTSWMRFSEVFRLTRFLCVPRPGDDPAETKKEIRRLADEYGAEISLSENCGPDISSTMVRSRTAAGESLQGLVPQKLEEYIAKHGLFR